MAVIEKSDFKIIAEKLDKIIDLLEGAAPPRSKLMTAAEAAKHYSVKTSTIYKWAREGRIPVHRTGTAGKILVNTEEVDQALKKGVRA